MNAWNSMRVNCTDAAGALGLHNKSQMVCAMTKTQFKLQQQCCFHDELSTWMLTATSALRAKFRLCSADLSWVVGCNGFTIRVSIHLGHPARPILASCNVSPSLWYASVHATRYHSKCCAMLSSMHSHKYTSARTHTMYTSVCIYNPEEGQDVYRNRREGDIYKLCPSSNIDHHCCQSCP